MKTTDRLSLLMGLYFSEQISVAEKQELWDYLNDPKYSASVMDFIPNISEYEGVAKELHADRQNNILSRIYESPSKTEASNYINRQFRPVIWVPAMAAALAAIIFGVWFFTVKPFNKSSLSADSDILAGQSGATLSLANGRKIVLQEAMTGQIAQEDGVVIRKSAKGEVVYKISENVENPGGINKLSTEKGQTFKLQLPDGSLVWLNSSSTLIYSSTLLRSGRRIVDLIGEGYFEIAKDSKHPFIVNSNNQQLEVLGTHFNVNAYPNEPAITTTLLEGAVRLNSGNHTAELRPNQKAVYQSGFFRVGKADPIAELDWKEGDFNFNRIDFRTAMRKIERWYDVQVIYDPALPDDLETGGWISRSKSLNNVLAFIESSGLVHFRVEGRKIYISK